MVRSQYRRWLTDKPDSWVNHGAGPAAGCGRVHRRVLLGVDVRTEVAALVVEQRES